MFNAIFALCQRGRSYASFTEERQAIGMLSAYISLFCNILLSAVKAFVGLSFNSLAILGDAINNFTDAISSIISLISFQVSARPADKEHPYGHARIEYFMSSLVALLILYAGGKLLLESIRKTLQPSLTTMQSYALVLLGLAVLVKVFLWRFQLEAGRRARSDLLRATALDSLSDVLTSGLVLVSLPLSTYFALPIDGPLGLLLAGLIIRSGLGQLRQTVDKILGGRPSAAEVGKIREFLLRQEGVEGTHELMIHDYGPGKTFVTVHAEVDGTKPVMYLHELIDRIERKAEEELAVHLTVHMDPLLKDDARTQAMSARLAQILSQLPPQVTAHDLRLVARGEKLNLVADLLIPVDYAASEAWVQEQVETAFATLEPQLNLVLQVERDYL